jgi:hypothetical protein
MGYMGLASTGWAAAGLPCQQRGGTVQITRAQTARAPLPPRISDFRQLHAHAPCGPSLGTGLQYAHGFGTPMHARVQGAGAPPAGRPRRPRPPPSAQRTKRI